MSLAQNNPYAKEIHFGITYPGTSEKETSIYSVTFMYEPLYLVVYTYDLI